MLKFLRRKRGTPKQVGKVFPVGGKRKLPPKITGKSYTPPPENVLKELGLTMAEKDALVDLKQYGGGTTWYTTLKDPEYVSGLKALKDLAAKGFAKSEGHTRRWYFPKGRKGIQLPAEIFRITDKGVRVVSNVCVVRGCPKPSWIHPAAGAYYGVGEGMCEEHSTGMSRIQAEFDSKVYGG